MSHVEKALGDAREAVRKRGHTLGRFTFKYSQARAECESCGCAVLVTVIVPARMTGAALGLSCKDGNAHLFPPPAAPAPPTGRARRIERNAPVRTGVPVPVA